MIFLSGYRNADLQFYAPMYYTTRKQIGREYAL